MILKRKKKAINVVPFQNDGHITEFYFASFPCWPKFEKPLSQRKFFNEIWLKVGQHEWIYITEITFKKKIILFQNGGRNIFFLDIAQ